MCTAHVHMYMHKTHMCHQRGGPAAGRGDGGKRELRGGERLGLGFGLGFGLGLVLGLVARERGGERGCAGCKGLSHGLT